MTNNQGIQRKAKSQAHRSGKRSSDAKRSTLARRAARAAKYSTQN